MRGREPIMPQRRRRIPPQFSWVDHRLVREGHLQGRSAPALALYLVLVTVGDADGLSWYSDQALCRLLGWTAVQLREARAELRQAALVAYRKPLYQVLDLSPVTMAPTHGPAPRAAKAMTVGDILHGLLRGGAQ